MNLLPEPSGSIRSSLPGCRISAGQFTISRAILSGRIENTGPRGTPRTCFRNSFASLFHRSSLFFHVEMALSDPERAIGFRLDFDFSMFLINMLPRKKFKF